jgi:ActR/RegA family two-component response regulator
VNAGPAPPAALIVDDDVAFLLWLGEMFAENGYQSYPALTFRQALALTKKLALEIDVLVANPKLRGAARAMEKLSSERPNLRVVLIGDPAAQDDAEAPSSIHPTLSRPSAWEPIVREQWIAQIRKVLMRAAARK